MAFGTLACLTALCTRVQAASRLSKPSFAGPADNEQALRRALELPGIAGVVSSAPLRMGRLLSRWRAACGPRV